MPVTNYYTVNGEIISEVTNGVRTDYMTDALGSETGTLDQNGNVLNTYRYKPYGGLLAKTGVAADPEFPWNGGSGYRSMKTVHADDYVRARTVASTEGAWTGADRFWPRLAAYGYVSARPQTIADPLGFSGRVPPHTLPVRGGGIVGGWDYGSYCGPAVKQNPAWHILPQDCIDACCMQHDRCIEAQFGAGLDLASGHGCCDSMLAEFSQGILNLGCCSSSPDPLGCQWAAITIAGIFSGMGLNPYGVNCVPRNEWSKYSRTNWCGKGRCQEKSIPSQYGPLHAPGYGPPSGSMPPYHGPIPDPCAGQNVGTAGRPIYQ